MDKLKPKIFLSYAHEDIGMAKRIYHDLKQHGLDVWFNTESLKVGQLWENAILDAIEESDYFIAVLSSNSMTKKGYVQKELKTAFDVIDLLPEDMIYILPVRIDDCLVKNRKLNWRHRIDIFPENEYKNGLTKILHIVSPRTFIFRNEPQNLSSVDVNEMLRVHGFYDQNRNPEGKGVNHQYELLIIEGDKIIFDKTTDLIWQQSGSDKYMSYKEAGSWIKENNNKGYAGYQDWHLPTLEEAMSLMESKPINRDLYIDPLFDRNQSFIWTADLPQFGMQAWAVAFIFGLCILNDTASNGFVRAVRSVKSSMNNLIF